MPPLEHPPCQPEAGRSARQHALNAGSVQNSFTPEDSDERARTLRAVQRIASATGELSDEGKRRLARIEKLFAVKAAETTKKEDSNAGA